MTNSVCAIIVTYQDRMLMVNRVVKEALAQGVAQVIVVANGTSEAALERLEKQEVVQLVSLEKNYGAGHGFKVGLEHARNTACEHFWLLDDDNLPEPGCLEKIQAAWQALSAQTPPSLLAVFCYRDDQFQDKQLHQHDNLLRLQPPKNSCINFHMNRLIKYAAHRFSGEKKIVSGDASTNSNLVETDAAFFGGMFVHHSLLDQVTFPETDYFVYAEDLAFSHEIVRAGGKLYLLKDARIQGLDSSISYKNRKSWFYHPTLDFAQASKAYYYTRNLDHHTRQYFVSNQLIYYWNVLIFLQLLWCMSLLRAKPGRFWIVLQGIWDSWRNHLGPNPRFPI